MQSELLNIFSEGNVAILKVDVWKTFTTAYSLTDESRQA